MEELNNSMSTLNNLEMCEKESPDRKKSSSHSQEGARSESRGISLFPMKHLNEAIARARDRFFSIQSAEGYWVFELEADVTIPSEYILLQRFLGREMEPGLKERLGVYLRQRQLPDGGWPLFEAGGADISASVKAYFALKQLGDSPDAPHMVRARTLILSLGGAARVNVFTRITLALFGQLDWRTTPAMPIEIMLLPRWFFFHLDKVSYWSRTVIVPLLILYAKRPVCRLRPEEGVRELFVDAPEKLHQLDRFVSGNIRKNLFLLLDRVLKRTDRFMPGSSREKAIRIAESWTRERMQGEGGVGAIFPAMANAVMALKVLGYPDDDPDVVRGIKSVDDLLVDRCSHDPEQPRFLPIAGGLNCSAAPKLEFSPGIGAGISRSGSMCQPCHSPIWDTCLSLSAMLEAGVATDHSAVSRAVDWLFEKQIFVKGDWSRRAPGLEGGGWAFQFENSLYPDVDDTPMVLMALLRAGAHEQDKYRDKIAKAANWVIGMQSSDGGWGAFDIDNNYLYLNDIPFADHGALLDPSTSDLTGRCIELLSMLGFKKDFPPIARGLEFLRSEQEEFGGWFGRWGVNYIYGTWSVLMGLRQAGEDLSQPYIRKAADWLKSCQNADNGWGETCYSYDNPSYAGQGVSTPSQTAWALLGLMAAGEVNSSAVQRGINYLISNQDSQGIWEEKLFTGTGFPKVFYLRYHGYGQYFPLWALGVYRRLRSGRPMREDEVSRSAIPDLHLPAAN